jgi:hypothetical protein
VSRAWLLAAIEAYGEVCAEAMRLSVGNVQKCTLLSRAGESQSRGVNSAAMESERYCCGQAQRITQPRWERLSLTAGVSKLRTKR